MTPTPRVLIEPTTFGNRGQRYRVTRLGNTIVESSRNPEFDACRVLYARGVTGTLEIWRRGKSVPDARLDIQRGAKLTISETDDRGLRLVRWQPFSADQAPNAVRSGRVESRAADLGSVATLG